jgi:uncharacterized LabA/DUF88 family protein
VAMLILKPRQPSQGFRNAIVYTDYENIYELLRQYGQEPLAINFFRAIKNLLRESNLNIIDFIVYTDFEMKSIDLKQQTQIRALGLKTRYSSNHDQLYGDLELTVDAARTLYKNHLINVFVIISSGRDLIPLLKAIKCEKKVSYLISTRNDFNQEVIGYADYHKYIEDIF